MTCTRCGLPTIFKLGVCADCQTPTEQSTKKSERRTDAKIRAVAVAGGTPAAAQTKMIFDRDMMGMQILRVVPA